jgi:hypothetical protein
MAAHLKETGISNSGMSNSRKLVFNADVAAIAIALALAALIRLNVIHHIGW